MSIAPLRRDQGKPNEAPNILAPVLDWLTQAVDPNDFKQRQDAIFKPWIKGLIPEIGPDDRALSLTRRDELLDHCHKNQDRFFAACRSLAVEDALTAARIANRNRNPQLSDGIDLMHSVIAISYCDHFVVRDGFVAACADYVFWSCRTTFNSELWIAWMAGMLLDGEIFYTLREAQIVIESWRRHFNAIRPHESLGYKPPAPEVFVQAFAAWPAALEPAPPATLPLAQRPTLN